MKKYLAILSSLAVILFISVSAKAYNFPHYTGYVNDFAGVMDQNTIGSLNSEISSFNRKTGIQIAVVTVKDTGDMGIDEYANRLFKHWGVGVKGLDNGVMLIAAMKEKRVRIEVGYGLEPALTDEQSGVILRHDVIPAFKQGQFSQGILAGTLGIINSLSKSIKRGDISSHALAGTAGRNRGPGTMNMILGILLFLVFIYFAIRHPFLTLMFLGGGFGGGGGGFGGGGGGFGGFGGGMSGGGGASGGW